MSLLEMSKFIKFIRFVMKLAVMIYLVMRCIAPFFITTFILNMDKIYLIKYLNLIIGMNEEKMHVIKTEKKTKSTFNVH